MSKQRPTVEWIVAESEAEWERLCPPSIPDLSPHRNKRMGQNRNLWVVGTLLLLLASVRGSWSHGEQNALPPTADEIVTLQAAPGAIAADHRSLVDTVIGDQMPQDWQRHLQQEESNGQTRQANPPGAAIGIEISKIETLGDRAVVSIIQLPSMALPLFDRHFSISRQRRGGYRRSRMMPYGGQHARWKRPTSFITFASMMRRQSFGLQRRSTPCIKPCALTLA